MRRESVIDFGVQYDDRDAEAIADAATWPTMRFVTLKSEAQLDMQILHRVRDQLVGERAALMDQIRAILLERGHVVPQGHARLAARLARLLDDEAATDPGNLADHGIECERRGGTDPLLTRSSNWTRACWRKPALPFATGGARAAGIWAAGAPAAGIAETAPRHEGCKYRSTRLGSRLRYREISSAFQSRNLMPRRPSPLVRARRLVHGIVATRA